MRPVRVPVAMIGKRFVRTPENTPFAPVLINESMQARLRQALDAAAQAALLVGESGTILYASVQARQLFRCSDMEGKLVEDFMPAHLRRSHEVYRNFYQKLPTSRAMSMHPRLLAQRADKSDLWVQIELTPIWTSRGVWTIASILEVAGEA